MQTDHWLTEMRGSLRAATPSYFLRVKDRILASPIGTRLAKGTFWNLMAGCASRFLAMVASVVVARFLGREAFGQLGILQSTLEMFGSFAIFGMGLTSTKFVAECRKSNPDKAGRIIAMTSVIAWGTGGIATIALIFCSSLLAAKTLAAPELGPLLQISAISLLFGAVNGAQVGALAGFEAFKEIAQINLVSGILTMFLRVTGAVTLGLKGAVYGMVVAQMCGCAINFLVLRRLTAKSEISVKYSQCFQDLPVIWKFSLPAVLTSFLIMPTNWICNAMLVNRAGGYGEMAVYNAANQWFYLILFIPGLVGEAFLPVLFERMSHRDHRSAYKIFVTSIKLNAVVILPLILFGVFSKQVMGFYGHGFSGGWETLVIVLATAGLQAIQMPTGYVISASGRMWVAFTMAFAWAISFGGVAALLVARGSLGLALARLMALGLHCTWTFAFAFYLLKTRPEPKNEPQRTDISGQPNLLATLDDSRAMEMLD